MLCSISEMGPTLYIYRWRLRRDEWDRWDITATR